MKKNITSYILTRLFRMASEDDIIYSVCQKTGLDWEKAKALVDQVREEHATELETRQIPLKSFLSFLFYVLGIVLLVGPLIYLWIMLDISRMFLLFISSPSDRNAEMALQLFQSRCMLLGWFELPSIFFTMSVGVGIMNANLRYMRGLWETLFRQWNVID